MQVSSYPLVTLEPDDRGRFIAVGSENGNTTILELSHHLIDQQKNEKNIFLSVQSRLCFSVYVDSGGLTTRQWRHEPPAPNFCLLYTSPSPRDS